ncbi:MAG: cytochrome C, partial [Chloroflexales bacterium]
ECHGKVTEMPVVWQPQAFFMGFCLNCHRNPENFLRPRDQVFNLNYIHPANQVELGQKLVQEYGVMPKTQLQNCWVCHR